MGIKERLKRITFAFDTEGAESVESAMARIDALSPEQVDREYDEIISARQERLGVSTAKELKEYSDVQDKAFELIEAGKDTEGWNLLSAYEAHLLKEKLRRFNLKRGAEC